MTSVAFNALKNKTIIPPACAEARRGLPAENLRTMSREISERQTQLESKPVSLALDLSGRGCNLNCFMCSYPELRNETHRDSINRHHTIEIINECLPYALGLQTFGTEPLIYREEYGSLLELAEHYPNILMSLCTNGVLLNKYWIDRLTAGNFNRIAISIDAATPGTFRKIRGVDVFDKVVKNVSRLSERRNPDWTKLQFNFIVMRQNIDEMLDVLELADRLGVDAINFQTLRFDYFNLSKEKLARTKRASYYGDAEFSAKVLKIEAEARRKASELGINYLDSSVASTIYMHNPELAPEDFVHNSAPILDENLNLESKNIDLSIFSNHPRFFCTLPFTNLNLSHDEVQFCCWTTPKFLRSDLTEPITLESVWNSEWRQEARRMFFERTPHEVCKPVCAHVAKGGFVHGNLRNGVDALFNSAS